MGSRRAHCERKSPKSAKGTKVNLNRKERRAIRFAELMEVRKLKKKISTTETHNTEPTSIITEEAIKARFRNRVVSEIVESEKKDTVSKPVPCVSAEVKVAEPKMRTSDHAVIVSASTSSQSIRDKIEVSALTSSSTVQLPAAVGLLTTTLASSCSTDSNEEKKTKLNLGETLMPWRLRPISRYMTYIPTPKSQAEEVERRSQIKRCSNTTQEVPRCSSGRHLRSRTAHHRRGVRQVAWTLKIHST
ncbi:hypothetical protein TKK_0011370 [Trichogramma kaykai]|uniref:Uncharacterized protein n=1 Tax=Trichogramma kaykai TaxID=54128 RepID=A0ABD2WTM0_9HYME